MAGCYAEMKTSSIKASSVLPHGTAIITLIYILGSHLTDHNFQVVSGKSLITFQTFQSIKSCVFKENFDKLSDFFTENTVLSGVNRGTYFSYLRIITAHYVTVRNQKLDFPSWDARVVVKRH